MTYEKFIRNIMCCPEYQKANSPRHPCHDIIYKNKPLALCEPFRMCQPVEDVEVMFLGLSPGTLGNSSPRRGASLEDVMSNCFKHIEKKYHTNYNHAMTDRIGKELKYVKANVVHGIGDKKSAQKALETCGDYFLKDMIGLFPKLKYVIVYDFGDRRVLNYINKKFGIKLEFKNNTAAKAITKNGLKFIAAQRTRPFIKRLPKAERIAISQISLRKKT